MPRIENHRSAIPSAFMQAYDIPWNPFRNIKDDVELDEYGLPPQPLANRSDIPSRSSDASTIFRISTEIYKR
jgi:hypothetical protein